jgi:hypothetical protein
MATDPKIVPDVSAGRRNDSALPLEDSWRMPELTRDCRCGEPKHVGIPAQILLHE